MPELPGAVVRGHGALRRGATGPPDFVGAGFQFSGTAAWFALLRSHPRITGPVGWGPELHFFDPFCGREMTPADVAAYHRSFPRRAGTLCGEWTSRYARDPWTPRLLARAAPEAKVLIMAADPFERYRRRLGALAGRRPSEAEQPLLGLSVLQGRYATHLRTLYEHVDPERVLVLQFERCRDRPLQEYRRTLRFLGVAEDHVPRRLRWIARGSTRPPAHRRAGRALLDSTAGRALRRRPSLDERFMVPTPDVEAALHRELDPEVRDLKALVAELDLSLWPAFAHLGREALAQA